ncbi:beta and beta-prime subunits of DNA dependent RNA-polymerase [Gymnopus androsaceus JB14]|uniref:DNA-directed RNA polymerase n=1 Tax=Gymnopus androsaceus JB14 TaxID=1447944 RepID=A0A6A4GUT0_9AGAR|nr:beta and beta-prime subunits of DNA dependent RNA-polymerase [Gymnopus androsaceus JB14]
MDSVVEDKGGNLLIDQWSLVMLAHALVKDTKVLILDEATEASSLIIFGIAKKKTVGASQGGLVHVVFREKGPKMTQQLFTGLQTVLNYWLFHNGFSIGIGDMIANKDTTCYITETIASHKANVTKIIEDTMHDRLKPAPGMTIRESFKSLVERELNLACDKSGQHAQKTLKEDNNMSVCVGQQSVEGQRIPFGFHHQTLPHFTKDNFSPESRGFVKNSYLRGLTPQEFFFLAMAGHEGLIGTAVKTAETGYIQWRLVKALEDVMVCYDGTVQNSLGDLIQFIFGEDEFEHNYQVDVTDPTSGFLPGVLQVGINNSSLELQKKLNEESTSLLLIYLPVDLSRIVQNATQIFHIGHRKPSDLNPIFIIDSVKALCNHLIVVHGDSLLSQEAQANTVVQLHMHLHAMFGHHQVLERFHLNKEAFEWVTGETEAKFNHKNVMLGVPQLKEIINVATNIKTSSLSVFLNPAFQFDAALAKNIQKELAYTSLQTVIATVEIWYDLDPSSTIFEEDEVFIESFFAIPDEEVKSKLHLQSLWLLHLELGHAKMLDCKLTMA